MLVTLAAAAAAEWNVSDMVGDVGWELCVIIADWDRISNEVQRNDDWSEILLTVDGLRNFIIWEFEPAADQKKSVFFTSRKAIHICKPTTREVG